MTAEGWPETEEEVAEIVATKRFKADVIALMTADSGMIRTETPGGWARQIKETLAARYGPELFAAMLSKYGGFVVEREKGLMDAFEAPILPEGAPWRCPFCQESYQFQTHPGCLRKALQERDEARSFARGVYRWGPRAQWGDWERLMPWLKESDG